LRTSNISNTETTVQVCYILLSALQLQLKLAPQFSQAVMEGRYVSHVFQVGGCSYFTDLNGNHIQVRLEMKSDCSSEYFATDNDRMVLKEFAYTAPGKIFPEDSITHVFYGAKGDETLLYGFYPKGEVQVFTNINKVTSAAPMTAPLSTSSAAKSTAAKSTAVMRSFHKRGEYNTRLMY
jgi:hypothetical protein